MCERSTIPRGTVVTYRTGTYGEALRVGTVVSGPTLSGRLPLYHIRPHGADPYDAPETVAVFRVERAPESVALLTPRSKPAQVRHVPISTGPGVA